MNEKAIIQELMRFLQPFAEAAKKAEISGRPAWEFCQNKDYEFARAAVAGIKQNQKMTPEYLDQMQAHVDAGGKLTHVNGVELLAEVVRLRNPLISAFYPKDSIHD